MHINYQAQLDIKKNFVNSAIARIGKAEDFEIDEIIGMQDPFRYRNKMIFPCGADKNGDISFGFFRERSHDLIPLSDCIIGDEINFKILDCIKEHMKQYRISAYDEKTHSGIVRRVFIRHSHNTGEIMIVISAASRSLSHYESLITRLRGVSDKIAGIILNVNKEKNNLVLGKEDILLYGKSEITDYICGLKYTISPHSFFQVNPTQTGILYKKAIEYADISSSDIVLDIYCGIGTISLFAAKYAERVIGVEIVTQAIENAKQNAIENNINNAQFYASDAQRIVPQLISNGLSPNVVILDPPRKGSDEATLSAITSAAPERIVYVSCNPATLARDMNFLKARNYVPIKGCCVDMFPHTTHVECVVCLTLK